MDPDSIAAAPSEENGNVPLDTPDAPSEPAAPETPAVVETETPAEPVAELYELPDGRKVDAETLSKEWKENFYPDYTRKSQALAAKERTITPPTDKLADPEFTPESYGELAQLIEERAVQRVKAEEQARADQARAQEDFYTNQLTEIKKSDPSMNESALFIHATKYGFSDLKQAHQNMRDMNEMVKKVQQTTAANISKRSDPVSVSPGAIGNTPDPSTFATARDFLASLKGSSNK